MRPTGTLLQLAACLSSLTPLTAAWPGWMPELEAIVVRRADSSDSTAESQATETASAEDSSSTKDSGKAVTTRNLNTAKVETDTASETGTGTATGKKGKSTTTGKKNKSDSEATHTTFAADDPAGGVTILTPITTAQATPLFKIGDYVTLGWNYTSLQGTPTAIDVLISCSSASETWTLTSNMTFETKVDFVWDSSVQATDADAPLPVELYTLIIKDSDASITDTADPGYLGVFSGLKFGMYTGKPYTPLADWTCVGCNGGPPKIDHHAAGFALTMSIITIASFTWFVAGLNLH
ncbi:hypothetical protein AK830_g319 [Neonectria ditissima]|uniref:DUF7137 domain-containing protein n=1 Tax=Neonectria ditissima TaxID=78410 RepID=A0A0P7BH52_9HYPO|nr:hypothetical protein AK830_g319 [Neonectria ditissima]